MRSPLGPQVVSVFLQLRDFVTAEPALASFRPTLDALLLQARDLCNGIYELGTLERAPLPRIPERALAENLVSIMAALPSIEDDEEPALRRAYGRLLANLAVGLTAAIFRDFPDTIPRE